MRQKISINRASSLTGGLLALTVLTACQTSNVLVDLGQPRPAPQPKPEIAQVPLPKLSDKVDGQKVGNGPVRIALLVPTSAQGGAGLVGKQLANAARIAVRDFGAGKIQLVIKDTKGKSAESALLAAQARNEGASLVLGPLFTANVAAASGVTLPSNIPMIAFSSDEERARQGVYLNSFTPQSDVKRTITYGIGSGANRIIAFLPNGAYGALAERALRNTLDRSGGQVVKIVRYAPGGASLQSAAQSALLSMDQANGLYIPDGGKTPTLILAALKKGGANLAGKKIMGSGQWENVNKNNAVLNGAIYAGPDKRNFEAFARRYQSTYGKRPIFTAALAYDAVSLAAQLVQRSPNQPYTAAAIEDPRGFNGLTGIFRFRQNGRIQRGLVVNQINGGQVTVVSPSPTGFGRGS